MKINDLSKLFYFKEAAEALNYTKAAGKLHISPSGLQQAVKSLEQSLDVQLFVRKSKGLALTPAGKILLNRVLKVMKELNLVEQELVTRHEVTTANLTILSTPGLIGEWVHKSLSPLHAAYPEVKIELRSSQHELALKSDEIDVYIGPKTEAAVNFKSQLLGVVHFKLYASPAYVNQYGHPKDISELKYHKLIKFSGDLQAYFYPTNEGFGNVDNFKDYDFIVDHYLTEYQLVEANLGIACLARDIVMERYRSFVDLFPHRRTVKIPLYMYNNLTYAEKRIIKALYDSLKITLPYHSEENFRLVD